MAERILETRGQCTTILGAVNMLSGFISGLSYYEDKTSTLNAKYGVNASVSPTKIPQLKYFGCGVKGYKNLNTQQGSRRYDPESTNMDLYQPIPIRCVPLAEEAEIMTPEVRKSYRLRVVTAGPNGVQYACYYLKVLTCDPATVEIIQKDADGHETVYTLDPQNLRPTPLNPEEGGVIDTNSGRTIVRATMKVNLYADEILEAINNLYDGDVDTYGRISEYGFYTGCEVEVDSSESIVTSGVNKEAVYVQLAKHVCSCGVDLAAASSFISPAIRFEHADILNINS